MTSSTDRPNSNLSSRLGLLWLALPVVVGGLLRLVGLDRQILGGDELHGVRLLLSQSTGKILTEFQETDVCLPLTALSRWLMDRGLPLTEWLLWWPSVVTGIALLVVVPWLTRNLLGRHTRIAFGWLAAISPPLIYFSRIARSYMPVACLASIAVLAFWLWWTRGGKRWGALYAASAAATVWMHLVSTPFVLAPFVWAGGVWIYDRVVKSGGTNSAATTNKRRSTSLVSLILLGVTTAGLILLVMLPALESLLQVFGSKQGGGRLSWEVTGPVLRFLAGTASPWSALGFWIAVLFGLYALVRRSRKTRAVDDAEDSNSGAALHQAPQAAGLFGYLLTLIGLQLLAVIVVEPFAVQVPLIFGRYLLVAWPIVLLLAAIGLATLWNLGEIVGVGQRWPAIAGRISVTVIAFGLVIGYPFITDLDFRFGSLAGSDSMIRYYEDPLDIEPRLVPDFYRRLGPGGDLADEPGSLVVSPWAQAWWLGRSQSLFASVHRRRVSAGLSGAMATDPRAAWRSFIVNNPRAFLASEARWIVVHRDPNAEFSGLYRPSKPDAQRAALPAGPREALTRMAGETEKKARRRFGPPDFQESTVVVWDLNRIRLERRAKEPAQ